MQVPNLNCRINHLERETKTDQVMIVTNLVPKLSSQLTGEAGPDPEDSERKAGERESAGWRGESDNNQPGGDPEHCKML